VQKVHNGHVCPICGRRYKSLVAHLQRMSEACEKHRILYALTTTASHAKETGHFIAVRKVDDRLSVVAYLLLGDTVRVVSAFLTSKLNIVEKRVSKGRWRRL